MRTLEPDHEDDLRCLCCASSRINGGLEAPPLQDLPHFRYKAFGVRWRNHIRRDEGPIDPNSTADLKP